MAKQDPFGPTLAITLTLALASVAVLICAMTLLVDPKPIPGLAASQRQDAETAIYVIALAVVVPLALLGGPRLAGAVHAGPNARALSALAALLTTGLAVILLGARWIDGTEVLLAGVVIWLGIALAALSRAGSDREWPLAGRAAPHTRALWIAAAVAAGATPLIVTSIGSLSVLPLLIGAAFVYACLRARVPALHGRRGVAVDTAVVVLLALLIPDLVVIRPEDPGLSPADRALASIMQFHHDFLVGPANQVMGGDVLLRDTASQYGVGSIYFLAGWFELMTISYGSFALLDGLLTAGLLATAYAVLRIAGCSRILAGSTIAVAVVALVYNRAYPMGLIPQEGPFRFGLPMGVILAWVVSGRWPGSARAARGAALLVVGASAIWAIEAFAATMTVFLALAGLDAYLQPRGKRLRGFRRDLLSALCAAAAAHVLFAIVAWAGTGAFPDWLQYLAFLEEFLFGDIGDLTYDVSRWSTGLALGAAYLSSLLALLLLLRMRPGIAAEQRLAVTALTGATAYGLVELAYFVDRSADQVVAYVSLPAVMAAALWLNLALRMGDRVPREARAALVAIAGALGVLLVSVGWSSIGTSLDRSPLAHLVPGGDSPRAAIARLRAFPPIDSSAPEGERLLDEHMPGERRTVVLTVPDLGVEVLIRRGRANALPLAYAREDDFAFGERLPGLLDAVRELQPGRRMLVDAGALSALATIRRNPRTSILRIGSGAVSALQAQALRAIDRRFRLKLVERGAGGLAVLQLERRSRG